MTEVYLHIGMPKTGTTFLQERVFPYFDELQLVRGYRPVRSLFEGEPRQSILLSDESLSGNPFAGDWAEAFESRMEVLASLFPQAHVVVGFRRHADLIVSLYKQHLHQGGTLTLDDFWPRPSPDERAPIPPRLDPDDLMFSPRVNVLKRAFSGRLMIYTQEELEQDPLYLIREFARFFHADFESARQSAQVAGVSWTGSSAQRNLGVRGWASELLRQLNRVDRLIKRLPGQPSWHHRIFRKLNIDPRSICQSWLRPFSRGSLHLDPNRLEWTQELFANDWGQLLAEVAASRTRHAASGSDLRHARPLVESGI